MSRVFFSSPCQIAVSALPRPVPPGHVWGRMVSCAPIVNRCRRAQPGRPSATVARRVPMPRREKQTVLTLKYLFEIAGLALLAAATAILLQDLYRLYQQSTLILDNQPRPEPVRPRWRAAGRITGVALGVLLIGLSIQVVPAGMAGLPPRPISG